MAFNAFIKIDGVTENLAGGELRVESFSFGVSNSGTGGSSGSGAGAGKAMFQDFSFTSVAGKQSPLLFQSSVKGAGILNATLTITDKIEPLVIHFSEVLISSYKFDEGAALSQKCFEGSLPAVQMGAPMESVSFNFQKIEFSAGGNTGSGGGSIG
jgi:type VI protein secretion system component Hcp